MFSLLWDYIAQRIDIKEEIYKRSIKKKEHKKIRYNKRVKTKYFTFGNLILLKSITPQLGKLTER